MRHPQSLDMPPARRHLLHLMCLLLLALPLLARAQAAGSEHRVALVIGNAAYRESPLRNPVNDARAMRDKLRSMGFETVYFENLQTRQVGAALREFRNLIRPGSVALFFYAGHGLQVRGENYLPTVDAQLTSEEDVPHQSLNLATVLNTMEDSKAAVNLVLLDACRNNPYARGFRSAATGLARVQAPSGTLIHYATRPGSVAEDGSGTHGTYTAALLAQIGEQGVPIEQALKRVTIRVRDSTKGKQEPWMEGSLTGDFYFIVNGNPQISVQPAPANADAAAWQAADSSASEAAYQAYLAEYPKGLYAAAARIKIAALRSTTVVAAAPAAPPAAAPLPLLGPVPAGLKDADGYLWREAQAKGGREHFEAYLQQFPKGRNATAARNALKTIAQREAAQKAEHLALAESSTWDAARQSHSEVAYKAFLQDFPRSRFAPQAQAALKTLQLAAATPPAPEAPSARAPDERQRPPGEREALRVAALRELSLARLSAAEFLMGAALDDLGDEGLPDEAALPQRNVRMAAFEIAYYEVTVGQFRKFADSSGYLTEAEGPGQPGCHVPTPGGQWVLQPGVHWRAPGYTQTDEHAVSCVSWNDAQAYLKWLNGTGERYRLPSEAEWEFAARAGTTTPRPWSEVGGFFTRIWDKAKNAGAEQPVSRACKNANVADESLRSQLDWPASFNCKDGYPFTVPGGYLGRNAFSLYDMLGNVAEWTQDCWHPNHVGAPREGGVRPGGDCTRRVLRGGSWGSAPHTIRSAARMAQPASYRAADLGFRIARPPKN